MEIIAVRNKEQAQMLYDNSALTFEGVAKDNYAAVIEWVKGYTAIKNERLYIIEGYVMNLLYGLTGNNAYPDDLHIVSMMLDDMENPMSVALPRFSVHGRWFDDVVDNNLRREREKE